MKTTQTTKRGRGGNTSRVFFALCVLFIAPCSLLFSQSVYVEDFTTAQEDIIPLMGGATDVLRSALLQNTGAEFTNSRGGAAWVVSGTVTRFGAVKPPESGNSFSGSVNVSVQLFNFLAPALQTGHIGSQNNKGRAAAEAEPRVVISARLVEIRTGRVAAAGTVSAVTWEDYLDKCAGLARELGRAMPFPQAAFSGAWTAVLEHSSGWEDTYRVNFRAGGQCGVTVTSVAPDGTETTASADGRYTWNSEILSVSVRFRDNPVAHVRNIDWKAVAVLDSGRQSFTIVIPISSQPGAERLRARFWKE
jgi:hypothetical protein